MSELKNLLKDTAQAYPKLYKKYRITDRQILILEYVESGLIPTTSTQVAEEFDISVPNASTQLATLYKKGYLKKKETFSPTGGRLFEYTIL